MDAASKNKIALKMKDTDNIVIVHNTTGPLKATEKHSSVNNTQK